MPIKKKTPVKSPQAKASSAAPARKLETSKSLSIFDIPVEDFVGHEANPNEQDEATFDQLVEGIRKDGFDEPVIVVESFAQPGKYLIASGHHRVKAARVIGLSHVPAVIKEGWNEDKVKIELVRRNNLRGHVNPEKFTKLFMELSQKGYDRELLKAQMGFTKEEAFKKVFQSVAKVLPPSQRKKLEEAKEKITSVDGLGSALNAIFKEHGSDLQHGFMVFSFAGKNHHFVECDTQLHKMLKGLEDQLRERGIKASDAFKYMVSNVDLSRVRASDTVTEAPATKKVVKPLPKKK